MKYLWDTNILVNIIRNSPSFKKWNAELEFFNPQNQNFISIASLGEIYSISLQRDWQRNKQEKLKVILKELGTPIPISNQKIIQSYSKIDAYSQGKLKELALPKGLSARNMGKNDIWIAATAHALDLTLITTDNDFSHLDDVFCKMIRISS